VRWREWRGGGWCWGCGGVGKKNNKVLWGGGFFFFFFFFFFFSLSFMWFVLYLADDTK